MQTYLIFDLTYRLDDLGSISRIWARNTIKTFIQIKLHVPHFKVMASDFHVTGQHAVLKSESCQPFTWPKGIQFVVLTADFNHLVSFVVSLSYLIKSFILSVRFVDICFHGSDQTFSKITGCSSLPTLQYRCCLGYRIERETFLKYIIMILKPIDWVRFVARSQAALGGNHGYCSIWKHNMILVGFVPTLESLHYLVRLIE